MADKDFSQKINLEVTADTSSAERSLDKLASKVQIIGKYTDELGDEVRISIAAGDYAKVNTQLESLYDNLKRIEDIKLKNVMSDFQKKGKSITFEPESDFQKALAKQMDNDKQAKALVQQIKQLSTLRNQYEKALAVEERKDFLAQEFKRRAGVPAGMNFAIGQYATSDSVAGKNRLLAKGKDESEDLADEITVAYEMLGENTVGEINKLNVGAILRARINDGLEEIETDDAALASMINADMRKVANRLGLTLLTAADMADIGGGAFEVPDASGLKEGQRLADTTKIGDTLIISAGKAESIFQEMLADAAGTRKEVEGMLEPFNQAGNELRSAMSVVFQNLPVGSETRNPGKPKSMQGIDALENPAPALYPQFQQKFDTIMDAFVNSPQLLGKMESAVRKFIIDAQETIVEGIFKDLAYIQSQRGKALGESDIGDDDAENLIRYDDEALRRMVTRAEEKKGLAPGTMMAYYQPAITQQIAKLEEMTAEFDALTQGKIRPYMDALEEAKDSVLRARAENDALSAEAKAAAEKLATDWEAENPRYNNRITGETDSSWFIKRQAAIGAQQDEILEADADRSGEFYASVIRPLEDNARQAAINLTGAMRGINTEAAEILDAMYELRADIEALSGSTGIGNTLRTIMPGGYQNHSLGMSVVTPKPGEIPDLATQVAQNPAIAGIKNATSFLSKMEGTIGRIEAENASQMRDLASVLDEAAASSNKLKVPLVSMIDHLEFLQEAFGQASTATEQQTEVTKNEIVANLNQVDSLKEAIAAGRQFVAAFDTEFNPELSNKITEASVLLREITPGASGTPKRLVNFVQRPADDEVNRLALDRSDFGAKTLEQLAERARKLDLAGIGSGDKIQNINEMYQHLKQLIDVINMLAALDIPIVGNAVQGAEFVNIAKSINYINQAIADNNLGLAPLGAPAGPYRAETRRKNPLAFSQGIPGEANILDIKNFINGIIGSKSDQSALAKELKARTTNPKDDKQSLSLGAILKALIEMGQIPEEIKRAISFDKAGQFIIDGLKAHTAEADNKAALIIEQALRRMFTVPVKPTQLPISPGGGGGNKPPVKPPATPSGPEGDGLESRKNDQEKLKTQKSFIALLAIEQRVRDTLLTSEQDILTKTLEKLKGNAQYQHVVENVAKLEAKIAFQQAKTAQLRKELATADIPQEDKSFLLARQNDILYKLGAQREKYIQQGVRMEKNQATLIKTSLRLDDTLGNNYHTTQKAADSFIELDKAQTKAASNQLIHQLKTQQDAIKGVERENAKLINQMVTARYALYDVGNAYQNVARNMFMAARRIFDVTNAYRSYETAFTSVERAVETFSLEGSKEEISSLKQALIDMSEQIPVAFENLAQIATLGAQMGVAASGIANFTEVVAKFSAITGIETDTVAQKFGRIAELANVQYTELENLGSAIAYASINAVATEPEILTLSESIAAVSEQAGFLPQEIVAMGTTLASIGIQAEQARGVFTRVFADIDRSVSQGASAIKALGNTEGLSAKQLKAYEESAGALRAFASTAGMSVDDFVASWGQQGKSSEVFYSILQGLNSTSDLTAAFDSLNIVETREINTLTRLANNLNVWQTAMDDANASYGEGAFLSEAFGKTVDNLDSKIMILQNNFKALTEELSKGVAPIMTTVIDALNEFMQIAKGIANNPWVQGITLGSLAFTALTGAGLLGVSMMSKLIAQVFAFRVAMINTANNKQLISGPTAMIKQLTGLGSGLIEMRDQLENAGPGARGVIEPINYSLFGDAKKRQAEILASQNIYIAQLDERKGKTLEVARAEADSVNEIVRNRKLEIAAIEASTEAGSKERINRLKALGDQTIYIETINGETRALTANEYARLKGIAASDKVSPKVKAEAQARIQNATAINLETRAAAEAPKGVLGAAGAVMRFASGLTTALGVFSLVTIAISGISEALKGTQINLLEAGGGVASLRDAIKSDTQAYNDLSEEQKALDTSYKLVTIKTQKYRAETDKTAESIRNAIGVSESLASEQSKVAASIEDTTVALGENTRAWLANAAIQDPNLDAFLSKYPNLFQDLQDIGLDFGSVLDQILSDPMGTDPQKLQALMQPISDQITLLKEEKQKVLDAINIGADAAMTGDNSELSAINQQIGKLEQTQNLILSMRNTLGTALTKNEIYNAINKSFGVAEDATNAILDLQEAYDTAAGSAQEMEKVLGDVKTATVGMLEEIDGVDPDIIMEINDSETIDAMIKIVESLVAVEKAAIDAASAIVIVTRMGSFTVPGSPDTTKLDSLQAILNSLNALKASAGATDGLDDTGSAAESAADKINRLVESALKGAEAAAAMKNALEQLGDGIKQSFNFTIGSDNLSNLGAVIRQIGENANGDAQKAINKLYALKIALIDAGLTAQNAGPAFLIIHKALKALGGDASMTREELEALRASLAGLISEMSTSISQGSAEPEIMFKTISDYVNGLQTVLSSAFDIRYGSTAAQDEIASAWEGITEAAKDAEDAIVSANNEINSMTADRSILLYQLSVAERYGDEKRAAKIRAELAKLDKDLADKQEELAKAQDAASGELTGNSQAAIKNRQTLRSLVQQYNSYLVAMANAGASTEELREEANAMAEEFYALGQEAGFSEDALREYALFFTRDFNLAAEMLDPFRDQIELTVNPDPTVRAVSELVYAVNQELGQMIAEMEINVDLPAGGDIRSAIQAINAAIDAALIKVKYVDVVTRYFDPGNPADTGNGGGGTGNGSGGGDGGTGDGNDSGSGKTLNPAYATAKKAMEDAKASLAAANATLTKHKKEADVYASMSQATRISSGVEERYQHLTKNIIPQWVNNVVQANKKYENALLTFRNTPQYLAKGGYAGMNARGTDVIPAMLSKGEYVINAQAAKMLGADFLNFINTGRVGLLPTIGQKPDFMLPGGGQKPSFKKPMQPGTPGGFPGEIIAYLSPEDRQLLRAAVDRPVNLYSDGVRLAQSVNNGNSVIAKRGTR